jgi:hypothetical protein
VAAVKAHWDCLGVFQHFGRVTADQVERRSNGELHARGNAGLLVRSDRWYCHGDGSWRRQPGRVALVRDRQHA